MSRVVNNLTAKAAWWVTGLFCLFLAAPLGGHILAPAGDVSDQENRALAIAPPLSDMWRNWPGFPARVNAWLTDRFGFRDSLIRLYAEFSEELLIGREWSAVRGDDGWLFIAMGDTVRMHQGLEPFAPGEAEAWLDRLKALEARVHQSGALFLIAIAPNKHTIYSEHLSEWPRLLPGETRLETLERLSAERGPALLSFRKAVLDAKAHHQIYFRTDTHWTRAGAYAGYRSLMQRLQAMGLETHIVERGDLKPFEQARDGDLNRIIADLDAQTEAVEALAISAPSRKREVERLDRYDFTDIDGMRVLMEDRGRPSVLVLHDSFANDMKPFLQESFDELTYIHHRFGDIPGDAINTGQYDVVILQVIERALMNKFVLAEPDAMQPDLDEISDTGHTGGHH